MEQEQQQELRAAQQALEAKQSANQILTSALYKAQQQLAVATQKANWRNLISLVGIGVAISVAEIAVPSSLHAENARKTAETEMQNKRKQRDELVIESEQQNVRLNQTQEKEKAVSPLIALKEAVNLVMQQAQFQGRDPIFSPDSKLVLTRDDNTIWLYDLTTGKKLAQFQDKLATFSPDGKLVLTDDGDTTWRLYDLTGKKLAQFQEQDATFSPDSKLILTQIYHKQVLTDDSGTIRLYDLRGKKQAQFQGNKPSFSPDSKLVTTRNGKTIRLYDLRGKKLAQFQGNKSSFSPDSKLVLTWDSKLIGI